VKSGCKFRDINLQFTRYHLLSTASQIDHIWSELKGVRKMTNASASEPAPKIVKLANSGVKSPKVKNLQHKRRYKLWFSFVLCVVFPLGLAVAYYGWIATDRFASRAGFSIRGIESGSGLDGLGALTGLASAGSTTADTYVVLDYLRSRRLLEDIDARLSLRTVFSDPEIDRLSRLAADAPIEDFVEYWNRRIHTQSDPTSGIIEFEVQSVTPDHAYQIGQAVLELTQILVNDLSASARQDALSFARDEVDLQEARLRAALEQIRNFRNAEQSVDPTASAALEIELLSGLEARLIDINARIAAQRESLNETAPSLVMLRREAAALAAQIEDRRHGIGGTLIEDGGTSAVTAQLAAFETLDVERRLAEQSYASALNSLEQARRDADRQQRYLAIHIWPQTPEKSEYPRRTRNIFLAGFMFFATWGIGTLLTYSVRDHLS
jgi:capsular polysaccharide transport system permease protein